MSYPANEHKGKHQATTSDFGSCLTVYVFTHDYVKNDLYTLLSGISNKIAAQDKMLQALKKSSGDLFNWSV